MKTQYVALIALALAVALIPFQNCSGFQSASLISSSLTSSSVTSGAPATGAGGAQNPSTGLPSGGTGSTAGGTDSTPTGSSPNTGGSTGGSGGGSSAPTGGGATGGSAPSVGGSAPSAGGAAASAPVPAPIQGLNYTMTFEDTFQSLSTISLGPTGTGVKWWNGTKQCCMDDSFYGNNLPTVMFPTKYKGVSVNPYSLLPGGGLNIALTLQNGFWSSGILSSVDGNDQGFKQKYGYFEIKCKLPKGPGVWPAFWMVNNDPTLPGEIDIFEYYGSSKGLWYTITLHDWRNGGNNSNISDPINGPHTTFDLTDDWHTFGMLWTQSTLKFYRDGVQTWQHATPDVMQTPYFIYVNNGMGGRWPTADTPTPSNFQVEYVRAWAAPQN